jgi:polyhydroxyalkanoate synthesis regulator phasin
MNGQLKRKLLVGGVAVLAVAVTGGAYAATRDTTPQQESQAVVNDAANELGVEPSELTAALRQALANRVDQAVEDGRLTKAEGDALKARINSGDFPLFGGPYRGFKHFGHWPEPLIHKDSLDTAASYLGLTEAQLRTQLNNGKTLAQVARDRDKSVDGLIDTLVKAQNESLDEAVEEGKLTQAEANQIKQGQRERIADFVNNGQLRFRFHGGDRGPGGPHFLPHFEAAASYLGLTEAQLRAQLASGKTLAQVARDQDKSVDGLVDAIVRAQNDKLDQAVEDGRLTQAEANEIKQGQRERIEDFVNNGHLRFKFRGGDRGPDGSGFFHPDPGLRDGPAELSPVA